MPLSKPSSSSVQFSPFPRPVLFRPPVAHPIASQTPLGALSVVISAVLSSIFLKEKLTFFGWLGCALCVVSRAHKNLQVECAVLTLPLFQAWLRHHRSQWTHGRIRRSDKGVPKTIPCCGICGVRKRHDCSFGCHCDLCCP